MIDLEQLREWFESGDFPPVPGGPANYLRRERWERLKEARGIVAVSLAAGRAMSHEECGRSDRLLAEAKELTPMVDSLDQESRLRLSTKTHPLGEFSGSLRVIG